jgi:hypothetical protein
LGVSDDIATVGDRKRVQKAVYLGQVAGADLGYRFSWYLMGPYSPGLTEDYFELDTKRDLVREAGTGKVLHPQYVLALRAIKPLLDPPEDIPLRQEQWLELLASYHYLRRVSKLQDSQAVDVLANKKPALVHFVDHARNAIDRNPALGTPG